TEKISAGACRDLSFNIGIGGPLPDAIRNLKKLTTLILAGCSFTGGIQVLGNLPQLSFLALNSNNFTGGIPPSFGLLSNLFWLDLADNQLSGSIPISSGGSPGLDLLTHTKHFHFNKNQLSGSLAGLFNSSMILEHILFDHNQLSGPIPPELGGIATLKIIRLDRNNFTGEVPANISKLDNLNLLNLANNQLNGTIPDLSSLSKLNVVDLSNNSFDPSVAPNWFSTLQSLTSVDQSLDPATCSCAYPYTGKMIFRAPLFADPSDRTTFQQLETSLWKELGLRPGAVFLSDVLFSSDDYLQVQVSLFPSTGTSFATSELIRIGFAFSNQTYKPPSIFGPYYFIGDTYVSFSGGVGSGKSQMSKRAIAGTAVGCSFLLLALMSGATFAILKKRRPEQSSGRANPFASWGVAQKDSGGAPQLKGARFFSFDELKNCTNNFSESHEIGSGGYGKVYKGTIEDGTGVAIKRAEYGSKQGAVEFKNEIELLSRVHHRNLGIIDPAIHDAAKSAGFRRFVQLAMECVEESASKRPTMSSVVKEIETMLHNEGLSSSGSSVTEFEHAGQATGGPYGGAVVVTGSSSSSSIISEEPSRSHRGTRH
uniref:Protein kinase domain-containing protein n=1 Tax=Aegilops tauschii subsp. strangulata TaxID=200361 RepID=A0A453FT59_AEGTS